MSFFKKIVGSVMSGGGRGNRGGSENLLVGVASTGSTLVLAVPAEALGPDGRPPIPTVIGIAIAPADEGGAVVRLLPFRPYTRGARSIRDVILQSEVKPGGGGISAIIDRINSKGRRITEAELPSDPSEARSALLALWLETGNTLEQFPMDRSGNCGFGLESPEGAALACALEALRRGMPCLGTAKDTLSDKTGGWDDLCGAAGSGAVVTVIGQRGDGGFVEFGPGQLPLAGIVEDSAPIMEKIQHELRARWMMRHGYRSDGSDYGQQAAQQSQGHRGKGKKGVSAPEAEEIKTMGVSNGASAPPADAGVSEGDRKNLIRTLRRAGITPGATHEENLILLEKSRENAAST